jgi:C4-dicarboxylate-specific signal transduction histidine kinase
MQSPGRVVWSLPPDPALTGALIGAGFEIVSEGAAVQVVADTEQLRPSGPFGPRRIVVIAPDGSAERALEAGAFRVLRSPLDPESLVVQVQRATTDWHRARRMVLQQAVVARVHDLVVATDMDGQVVFANAAFVRTLGQSTQSLIGVHIDTILQGAADAPEDEMVQYEVTQDVQTLWVKGAWQQVRDPRDQMIARLLVARDFTREHSLRQDLVRSGALAELGMLAAEVAHEVNNPATYLMTNLSILRDDLQAGTLDVVQAAELVDECLDGVNRITDIVRRMRSLASGHSDQTQTMIDLSWVIRDACRIAGLRVKYKAELHIHDAVMPEVLGSRKRIGQVVLNLVVNAADALGGQIDPMPRIDVSLGQDESFAWVDVRDNGPGVPEKMREQMFEAFVTSKSEEGGTGLGLAVSSIIAEEHGGRLELCRHDGQGAWFRLWLPLPSQ